MPVCFLCLSVPPADNGCNIAGQLLVEEGVIYNSRCDSHMLTPGPAC